MNWKKHRYIPIIALLAVVVAMFLPADYAGAQAPANSTGTPNAQTLSLEVVYGDKGYDIVQALSTISGRVKIEYLYNNGLNHNLPGWIADDRDGTRVDENTPKHYFVGDPTSPAPIVTNFRLSFFNGKWPFWASVWKPGACPEGVQLNILWDGEGKIQLLVTSRSHKRLYATKNAGVTWKELSGPNSMAYFDAEASNFYLLVSTSRTWTNGNDDCAVMVWEPVKEETSRHSQGELSTTIPGRSK